MLTLIVLFLLNEMPGDDAEARARAVRAWEKSLVPGSPAPSQSLATIPIIATVGVRHYQLAVQSASSAGPPEPILSQNFAVYLPSSLARSNAMRYYARLSRSDPLFHALPLVVSLHGAGGSAATEVAAWTDFAEQHQWIVVCPTLHASVAGANATDASLALGVHFIEAVLDSVLGLAEEDSARTPSLSLTRLIDRSRVLVTAHGDGGALLGAFALARPNYWSGLACRSCAFSQRHYDQLLHDRLMTVAADAFASGAWQPSSVALDGFDASPTIAQISHAFWSSFYRSRVALFQLGTRDDPIVVDRLESMHRAMRTDLGVRRVAHDIVEADAANPAHTARWWSQQKKRT